MLSDARTFNEKTSLAADVCIIGAGAAGISLARELSGTQLQVILLESGGARFEHSSQSLYRGQSTGRAYPPLETTRRRQFGGSTAIWFGRCRPLDGIDFEARAWIPHSGWPFSRLQLDPFYERAQALCQLGPYDYRTDSTALAGSGLESKLFQFSPPTHFGESYLPALEKSRKIHIVLHANVTQICLSRGGEVVSEVECATLSGKKFPVKSTIYILAAGGLENPRLLLESRNIQTNGVGNQNDLVGRFFMEHPFGFSGAVHAFPADFPQDYLRLNYESFQRNLGAARAIGLPDSLMRSEQLLNASAFFVRRPIYKTDDRFYSRRARGFLNLIEVLRRRRPPSLNLLKDLGETIFHGGTVLGLLTKAVRALLGAGGQYAIHIQAETVPNPESRVTLSSQKDALGMHQISLQWKLSSQDLESYQRFEDHVHLGLQKLGFRTTRYRHDLDDEGWPVFTAAGKHHMGTTRMSQNAREGVVDENCRVHGISNLYIAGSSVFPTSGMVNPTLTIVALAVRLADRVKQILA